MLVVNRAVIVSYMASNTERQRGNPPGPTAETVAANIKELRGSKPLRTLEGELLETGHPISASALQKIEAGSRRVDVDDLTACAVVLNVNPNRLLFPAADDDTAKVTGAGEVGSARAWSWAIGSAPITNDGDIADFAYKSAPVDDVARQRQLLDAYRDLHAKITDRDRAVASRGAAQNRMTVADFQPSELDEPISAPEARKAFESAKQDVKAADLAVKIARETVAGLEHGDD